LGQQLYFDGQYSKAIEHLAAVRDRDNRARLFHGFGVLRLALEAGGGTRAKDGRDEVVDALEAWSFGNRDPQDRLKWIRQLAELDNSTADLAAAGLAEKTGTNTYITALGSAVLERWEQLGVADDLSEHELVRNVVLADEGLRRGIALYTRARVFWAELAELRAAEDWFDKPFALYMASYLNWEDDTTGYNPWRVLRAANADPLTPDLAGWQAWGAAHGVTPAGWPRTRAEKFVSTVEGYATRYVGRVSFCMALEARRRALLGHDLFTSIAQWKVPVA
jgi:hypothetical protein